MAGPHELQGAIIREFTAPVPAARDATPALNEAFAGTETGVLALATWGNDAARVGAVVARWHWLCARLDDNGRHWLDWFVDKSLKPRELAIVLDALAR